MATIQFELERLYELVQETQTQRDLLSTELEKVHNTLETTRGSLDVARSENENLRMQIMKLNEHIKKIELDNYSSNHRFESIQGLAHTTYEFLKDCRKEKRALEKQIDDLTNGTIRYKRSVDPDDLEEYVVDNKKYLRDILTDAIYSRNGKLIGYLEEDSGKLKRIKH